MPRTVDHEERRSHIAGALVRVAGRDGLRAVTMRSVASEAGMAVRLVQYYFHTKAELVAHALQGLETESTARWQARLDALGARATTRDVFETFFAEALPTDVASRTLHQAFLSSTELALAGVGDPPAPGPARLQARFAAVLRDAAARGELHPDAGDPDREAVTLLALNHGLGTSVMIGHTSPEAAAAAWAGHLDRLLGRRD